jgi:hypothetical protein
MTIPTLADRSKRAFSQFFVEVWRIKWMVMLAVAIIVIRANELVPETSATLLIFYKPALAAIGFIAAHIAYQQAFPYLDQSELIKQATAPKGEFRGEYALLFLGASVLRGFIYAAFVLGVTLGL